MDLMHRMREFELLGKKSTVYIESILILYFYFLRIGNIYMFVLNSSLEKPQFRYFKISHF